MHRDPFVDSGDNGDIATQTKKPTPKEVGFSFWWARTDLNRGPKDSGSCDFRHSLDYAFTIAFALGGCRLVSTPSTALSH